MAGQTKVETTSAQTTTHSTWPHPEIDAWLARADELLKEGERVIHAPSV